MQNLGINKAERCGLICKCSPEQFDDSVKRLGSAGMQAIGEGIDDTLFIKSGQVFSESFAQRVSFHTFKHPFVESGERVVVFLAL